MLYVTTDYNKVKIKDIELYFNSIVDKSIFNTEIYHKIMNLIDNAVYIENDIVETPFGRTTLNNLSTGCKTVMLLIMLSKEKVFIPITECGINAINCIYELSNKIDLYTYTNYGFLLDNRNAICIIDGKEISGVNEIYHKLEG